MYIEFVRHFIIVSIAVDENRVINFQDYKINNDESTKGALFLDLKLKEKFAKENFPLLSVPRF